MDEDTAVGLAAKERSTFVSVVAWVFIALSAFTVLISVMQNIMLQFAFPLDDVKAAMRSTSQSDDLPPFVGFMLDNVVWIFRGLLVVSAFTLTSSIGLLLRKNWARLVFIGLMVLSIVWQVLGLGFQFYVFESFEGLIEAPGIAGGIDTDFESIIGAMQVVSIVMSAVFAAAFSALFGWIALRLRSPEIAQSSNDPDLAPNVPGLTDADSIENWDLPF